MSLADGGGRRCYSIPVFDVEICDSRSISLVSFHGEVSPEDFAQLDRLARARTSNVGFHVIYDMSRVQVNNLLTDFVAARGQLPQTFKDFERIYVVPQDDLKLLVRLYIAYQQAQGWRPPILVDSLDEALQRLAVTRADFRKLPRG
jgi:hypothetical protein